MKNKAISEAMQTQRKILVDALANKEPAIALHKDFAIENIEAMLPARNHFRGVLKTPNIESFIKYAKTNNQNGATCFVDPEKMSANIILDLLTKDSEAGHCLHRASNTLEMTAAYRALLDFNESSNPQKKTAEWLEEWPDKLTFISQADKDKMTFSQAVAAIRRIKITEMREQETTISATAQNRSALEEIDADANKTLPQLIIFTCTPYEGLEPRQFGMTLSVITKAEPQIILRIQQLERHKEEIAEEFAEIIINQLEDTEIKTYIGKFNTSQ